MEKHSNHLSGMYEQEVYTLSQSNYRKYGLNMFMLSVVFVQILTDVSLEMSVCSKLVNLIITCICALSFLFVFMSSFVKKELLGEKTFLITILLTCCIFSIIGQRIGLLYWNEFTYKNIALVAIALCLLFRLIFWIFLSLQKVETYKSTIRFGLLTILISLIGLFCFYQYDSVHIDFLETLIQSFVSIFSFATSYIDLLPIEVTHFYLIADSILWYLPCISFVLYNHNMYNNLIK